MKIRGIHVVYEWSIDGNQIYYIGISKGLSRATNMHMKTRNSRWASVTAAFSNGVEHLEVIEEGKLYKAGRIQLRIIADKLTENEAHMLEAELIAKYGRIGFEPNGILTNLQIGFAKGQDKLLNLRPVHKHDFNGKYLKTYYDISDVYIPGEELVIALCIEKDSFGKYKQLSTGGFMWKDANEFDAVDCEAYVGEAKGGNSTKRLYWKILGENLCTQGQRKIGYAIGGVDFMKKCEAGMKNFSCEENDFVYSHAIKITKDEFHAWKKSNKNIYLTFEAKYKEAYANYKSKTKRNHD